jgi:serpin B
VNEDFHRSQDALLLALAARNRERSDEADAQIFTEVNDVFVTEEVAPSSPYLDDLAKYYGAGAHQAKFVNEPEAARQIINQRVSDVTRALIPELLPEQSIDSSTVLVLTNALYFKAPWVKPLSEPFSDTFRHLDGSESQVPMLSTLAILEYAEGEGFVSIALPYFDSELEFLVVLPAADKYESVRSALDAAVIDDVLERRTPRTVDLTLPEFEIRSDVPIKQTLASLGVSRLFEPGAELPGIPVPPGTSSVYVTDVFHQATVAVDRHGTEASAATAVVVGRGSSAGPDDPVSVRLDRPFFFAIRDIATGSMLFVGQVVAP